MNTPQKIPTELLARLNGTDVAFHSSVYALEAQGNRLGSTSVGSFNDRLHLERNRRSVRSYRESAIGTGAPSKYHDDAHALRRGAIAPAPRQGGSATVSPKANTFREPPSRPYNPYG